MDILPGVSIVDLTLFLLESKTLILGDTHLGYEKELAAKGILIPKVHFQEVIERIKPILEFTKPQRIILNGDIKHEFGQITDEEWRQSMRLLDLLARFAPVTLVKGNHDSILDPIARHAKVQIVDHVRTGEFLVCHGDVLFDHDADFSTAKTIIIGHEHPALGLHDKIRSEKYKCFLKGKYKRKNLIVMPSFSQIYEGTDVQRDTLLSPFLQNGVGSFEAYVVQPGRFAPGTGNTLYFGPIARLK